MGGGLDFRLGSATGWCIGLVCGYFAAFAVTAAQLTVIYSRGARFRSFHGAFLALSALWLPMRVFILSMHATEPGAWGMYTVHGLYFLPTSLQVGVRPLRSHMLRCCHATVVLMCTIGLCDVCSTRRSPYGACTFTRFLASAWGFKQHRPCCGGMAFPTLCCSRPTSWKSSCLMWAAPSL